MNVEKCFVKLSNILGSSIFHDMAGLLGAVCSNIELLEVIPQNRANVMELLNNTSGELLNRFFILRKLYGNTQSFAPQSIEIYFKEFFSYLRSRNVTLDIHDKCRNIVLLPLQMNVLLNLIFTIYDQIACITEIDMQHASGTKFYILLHGIDIDSIVEFVNHSKNVNLNNMSNLDNMSKDNILLYYLSCLLIISNCTIACDNTLQALIIDFGAKQIT